MYAKLEHVLCLQYLLKVQRVKQKLSKNQKLGYALTTLSEKYWTYINYFWLYFLQVFFHATLHMYKQTFNSCVMFFIPTTTMGANKYHLVVVTALLIGCTINRYLIKLQGRPVSKLICFTQTMHQSCIDVINSLSSIATKNYWGSCEQGNVKKQHLQIKKNKHLKW